MSFLVVGGVTIGVAKDSVRTTITEIGDAARTFDGTWRQNIRNRVPSYAGQTPPLLSSEQSAQYAALTSSSQPVECYGDLLGSTSSSGAANYFTRALTESPIVTGSGSRTSINWELQASS